MRFCDARCQKYGLSNFDPLLFANVASRALGYAKPASSLFVRDLILIYHTRLSTSQNVTAPKLFRASLRASVPDYRSGGRSKTVAAVSRDVGSVSNVSLLRTGRTSQKG